MALPTPARPQETQTTLADFWTTRGVLDDTNGDGFADSGGLRLVLAQPDDEELIAAAANIATRLGVETMSLDLPLVAPASAPVVHLGAAAPDFPDVGELLAVPDVGFVYGAAGEFHVWAESTSGLRAAVLWLSGRAPYLWGDDGADIGGASDRLRDWLEQRGVPDARVQIVGAAVSADRPGLRALFAATDDIGSLSVEVTGDEAAPSIDAVDQIYWVAPTGATRVTASGGESAEASDGGGGGGREDFDLADMYSPQGLLGDSNGDLIPDRLDAVVSAAGVSAPTLATLGARLGLEAAGTRLPAAVVSDALEDGPGGTRVILGSSHPALEEIETELPHVSSGVQGQVDVVRNAYGDDSAILVRGSDRAVDAATRYLAETAPYLSRRGKDAPELATVSNDLRRFLARRPPGGQAAAALDVMETLLAEIPSDATDTRLSMTLDRLDPGIENYVRTLVGDRVEAVQLASRDVATAPEIWRHRVELTSEPAELRSRIDSVADELGESVHVRARISEPLEVRDALVDEITATLRERGATDILVEVLPAYKQGFGWLEERVLPMLRGLDVDLIRIEYARNDPPESWPYQAMHTPSRWLLELFPIDEILARELTLPVEAIEFAETSSGGPIYRVTASSGGNEVFSETFSPALVERPYFDAYPAYERVRVTGGWLRVESASRVLVDEHMPTDLERVWDIFQQDVLTKLHDYTMRLHDGEPRAAYAPHFGRLVANVTLSEPERPLGIDKERIAPMEALHEEIYFGVLHFFDLMGRVASGSALGYPGRVIPIVRPVNDGRAGEVEFVLTGFEAPVARVEVSFVHAGRERRVRRDLPPLPVSDPTVHSVRVGETRRADGVALWLGVDAHDENRQSLLRSYSARQLDGSWVASDRLAGSLASLEQLRSAGLYTSELAWEFTPDLEVTFGAAFEPSDEDVTVALAGSGLGALKPDPSKLVAPEGATHRVQWDTPMPPDEAHSILAVMAQEFDEASIYRLGRSYLGREIWGMDLIAPLPGSHWSQAKASAFKPTVVYSARQHANEVSSTSHVLRAAQHLLEDPDWADALKRLNVVVHPITKPDGAQLADDLHQITPDHMLHAGYLGALGVDATAGGGEQDPIYPESKVRERLWRTWLPDIFLNPHGYPSHEWVQPFSEYAGWVRHRTTRSRDWWGMRGWFMPGFGYLNDPEYPRHKEHAFQIRDSITAAINDVPGVAALNERAYARYIKYGQQGDPDTFRTNFSDDVLIYTSLKGSRAGGRGLVERNPKVTIWSGSTEAPDETAYGEWLELVASAGLAWDQAILRHLLSLEHPVERTLNSSDDSVTIRYHRERPGAAPAEPDEADQG